MSNPNFLIAHELIPSERLANEATRRGIGQTALLRDFVVVTEHAEAVSVAVGDMANNLAGKTHHILPELARKIGFEDADEPLNGGLIGSNQLRQELARPDVDDSGYRLITRANNTLERTYTMLGLPALYGGSYCDPAELFTGYVTHARIGREVTTLTSVGDVYAWVNGDLVAGAEKAVDTHKEKLVRTLTDIVIGATMDDLQFANVEWAVRDFAAKGKVPGYISLTLHNELVKQIRIDQETGALGRQTAYTPVDSIVTPWQIRDLQNYPSSEGLPWAYGAIDGRITPPEYITVREIPTAEIDTLVIATDGSVPRRQDGIVNGLEDLEPVNSEYSERGMVAVSRR